MCKSSIQSSVCPGPSLPTGTQAGSQNDTRCRACRHKAGEGVHSAPDRQTAVLAAQDQVRQGSKNLPKDKAVHALGNNWARFAEAFLIDAFDEVRNPASAGDFSLNVAGSLARRQATPYSDLEFYFVVKTPGLVVPFARYAKQMWKKIRPVIRATGSFTEDLIFSKHSRYNAVSPTGQHLKSCGVENEKVDFEGGLVDGADGFSLPGADWEQVYGSRSIAGDPALLAGFKSYLQTRRSKLVELNSFDELMKFNVKEHFQGLKKDIVSRTNNLEVNIKNCIIRTIQWVTICLGRFYALHGVGDVAQMTRLLAHNKISRVVYDQMLSALNCVQAVRYKTHMASGRESDRVGMTDKLGVAVRTCSGLVEMYEIWMKKKRGKASPAEKKRDCFRTSHPERYDWYNIWRGATPAKGPDVK
jgi:hypothetical protein